MAEKEGFRIQPNQTLAQVAEKYCTTPQAIFEANEAPASIRLDESSYVGRLLHLPPPDSSLSAVCLERRAKLFPAHSRGAVYPGTNQPIIYPFTSTIHQLDDYHGTFVADPYRWLEEPIATSGQVQDWVRVQNQVTQTYLGRIPYREKILQRVTELNDYSKYSPAFSGKIEGKEYYFFNKNDGLQNQSVLYIQEGLTGEPKILINPNDPHHPNHLNIFSADGTSKLTDFQLSQDGRYAVYGVSKGGADLKEFFVLDMKTRKTLPTDHLEWIKFSRVHWHENGFFYSRYPEQKSGNALTAENTNRKVYYHAIGTPQSSDILIYEDPAHPKRSFSIDVTEDGRFAFLPIYDGSIGKEGNSLLVRDLKKQGPLKAGEKEPFLPVIRDIGDEKFDVLDSNDGKLLIKTDYKAPKGRVVLIDPANPDEKNWKELIPEQNEPIEKITTAGKKIFVTYLKDVASHVYVYNYQGGKENKLELPDQGLGSIDGDEGLELDPFSGKQDATSVFYKFSSSRIPPTVYRYDIQTGKSEVYQATKIKGYNPDDYELKQVFYPSKDGTRIPMFLVYKKGIELNGKNPTLLRGYGGFAVSILPYFNAIRLALLEQGFVIATANLRGGAEYGEEWHQAGTKLKKQNVFDDFIAAAEWLIGNHYTSSKKLAINGGSNGGLLIGAVLNQRPDLFAAAVPDVGVMDMCRYQKFTAGASWARDYGLCTNPEEFKAIFAYSPLHNVQKGKVYPAVLVTTADHDDRVAPGHSFKYVARMQALIGRQNPVLIRVDTNAGHGGNTIKQLLNESADLYSFYFYNLGVTPRY